MSYIILALGALLVVTGVTLLLRQPGSWQKKGGGVICLGVGGALLILGTPDLGQRLQGLKKAPQQVPAAKPRASETGKTVGEIQLGRISGVFPYKTTVDSPFQLVLTLEPNTGCRDADAQSKGRPEVLVNMYLDQQVEYDPKQFKVSPCKNAFVRVTVKKKEAGLASLAAFADGYDYFSRGLDVGFDGKVKVTSTAPLSYDEPGTLNVEIVGQDDKPLRFPNSLDVILESVDAALLVPNADANQWTHSVTLSLGPGARSSPQFQIKSEKVRGGAVHLSTSLLLGDVVIGQENHSFEAAPASWLPVLLAIIGALLYGVYSILSDDSRTKWKQKLLASAVAGTIAWLFTGFDLLGLKLDTSSLRTYAITGFLFCFLGVDVLLSKKFPRTIKG